MFCHNEWWERHLLCFCNIQDLKLQLHRWRSEDLFQIFWRETVLCWSVMSHNSPPVTCMSPFKPTMLRSLRNSMLIFLKPQASVQSVGASLFLQSTGRRTQVSPAKWLKASPQTLNQTPQATFSVRGVNHLSFNYLTSSLFCDLLTHCFISYSVDPSVELLLVPSEESVPQRLLCSGWGFDPQIEWFSESQQISPSSTDISINADGLVAVTSQLHVPQSQWRTGKVFTCKVSDRSLHKTLQKEISLCSGK